jgi:hypothetical protein
MNVRLIKAPISLSFTQAGVEDEEYIREYHQLSESDDDPINQWLKLAKAKGETADTDPVVLNLLVELYKKIDALEMYLKDEKPQRLILPIGAHIESIGFGHFELKESLLQEGASYYARIEMPVHPKRDIAIFFEAKSSTLAKITRMHERDEKDWNAYLTARERVLIREAREKK